MITTDSNPCKDTNEGHYVENEEVFSTQPVYLFWEMGVLGSEVGVFSSKVGVSHGREL